MFEIKVLMLGWELPPYNSGGLGEACWGITSGLSNLGIKITFVLPNKVEIKTSHMEVVFAANCPEDLLSAGAYDSGAAARGDFFENDFPPDFLSASFKYASLLGEILKKRSGFDLIHMHDWMTFPAGIFAKRLLGVPLVAHIHSTEIDRTGGIHPNHFVFEIEKRGMETADIVVAVSQSTKKIIVEKYGISPEKIQVVHNGVYNLKKPTKYSLKNLKDLGFKIVLFLGRITLQKGPEYFVRAAEKTLKFVPNALFVVTGTGDMQEAMVSESLRLGISDKFIFTGFLRDDERDGVFQSADVYVMPSVSEPFGISALESLVNETPVILSNSSGASEVVAHALKVDFWDIDEMTDKIVAVLTHEALENDLIFGAKREVAQLTWDKTAEKILNVYGALTNNY